MTFVRLSLGAIQYLDVIPRRLHAVRGFPAQAAGSLRRVTVSRRGHFANVTTSIHERRRAPVLHVSAPAPGSPRTLSIGYTLRRRIPRLLVRSSSGRSSPWPTTSLWLEVKGSPDWAAAEKLRYLP